MGTISWCMLGFGAIAAMSAAQAAAAPAAPADLSGPHLVFIRTIPAPLDLRPAERIAVVSAAGAGPVGTFVDWFVEYAGKNGALSVENAVNNRRYANLEDPAMLRRLRREHPADLYVCVTRLVCSGTQRSAARSEREGAGRRIVWLDAACEAQLEVRGTDGKRIAAFGARGEGTSPRVSVPTDDERQIAFGQAARYAALDAAQTITPRVIRDSIELDDSAPQFADGWRMIDADRLRDARAIWELALRTHRGSAALQYDLGALCEALGDVEAARGHLEAAVHLAPGQRRYREELAELPHRFRRR